MLVGRLFGLRIRVNLFFLIILISLGTLGFLKETIILFLIVMGHEFSHAFAARAAGMRVVEIELLPYGGVARIDGLIEIDPWIEMKVALAGPAFNLVTAAVALLAQPYLAVDPGLMAFFLQSSLLMAAFNLLPALPLDGGRIYRAWLVRKIGFRFATQRAVSVARVFGLLFLAGGMVGLWLRMTNLTLFLLGAVVLLGAGKEPNLTLYAFLRSLTEKKIGLRRGGAMEVVTWVFPSTTRLGDVVIRFVPGRYSLVMAVDDDLRVLGQITEGEVVNALFSLGLEASLDRLLEEKVANLEKSF